MAEGILNPIPQLEADFDFDVYTKQEVDALLDEKADKVDTYTKTETDTLLSAKADADAVYTKTETDTLLDGKADKSTTLAGYGITDAYTKTETDNLLNGKADADDVYTKSEIDTKIPNSVGSATKPVYVNGGVVSACTYELNKTVPANAVFTDTTYTAGNGLNLSGTSFSAKAGTNVTVDGSGINVNGNGTVASADSGLISGGTAFAELRPTLDGTWVKNAQTTAINLQKLEGGIEYLYGLLSHQYDQLKKYINGNYYDYDTDTDSKYVKTVPAGAMPYASLDSIGGKTLVWNQLLPNGNFADGTGWNGNVANNEWSYSETTTAYTTCRRISPIPLNINHKYYISAVVSSSAGKAMFLPFDLTSYGYQAFLDLSGKQKISWIYTAQKTDNASLSIRFNVTTSGTSETITATVSNYICVDLTLMYGSGNEPTTVAEFQQMFPADYYSYNAGTLLSAGVTEVKSVGKNLLNTQRTVEVSLGYTVSSTQRNLAENQVWKGMGYSGGTFSNMITSYSLGDGTLTYKSEKNGYGIAFPINVKPSTNYTFHCTKGNTSGMFFLQYGADGYLTSNTYGNVTYDSITITTTATTAWLMVGFAPFEGSINTDLTINDIMVEESSTDSAYTPYNAHTYPIPASIQALEGYGWSAGSVYNYIDYERKVFVKNVDRANLGSLTWQVSGSHFYTSSLSGVLKSPPTNGTVANILNQKYVTKSFADLKLYTVPCCSAYPSNVQIYDTNYTLDAGGIANLTADLSGVYLYYELATPQEIDISAYLTDDNLIEVESGGTLTFENQHGDDYRIDIPSAETYMVDLQSAL